tara:strand:+ start:74 stop:334 length:261 start_codon:yes stop_codon:yes gene_type:complete
MINEQMIGTITISDDDIWMDFLENASDREYRRFALINCDECGGDGIYTDSQDDYSGGFCQQYEFPASCPCLAENDDKIVEYWRAKK